MSSKLHTVSLIGLPGSGKTTVGRHLARRLNTKFVDTDLVIEQRIGCSIRCFFAREGETGFRDIEQAVINELTSGQLDFGVLATGGGAVLKEANRHHLYSRTQVVYLHASLDELYQRLRHDHQRPLMQVADPRATLDAMYAQRDPLYRETAHWVIDTAKLSTHALVQQVLDKIVRFSV